MTRLMSNCTSAMVAANIAVIAPTTPTTWSDGPATSKSGIERATRYTPDVTIVAAWMSADTGVGPSMASGSHEYSGSWADLPVAPKNSAMQMSVSVAWAGALSSSRLNTSGKFIDPKPRKIVMTPIV